MQTIMIIEDDEAIREELALLLENEGYKPLPVTDFDSVPAQAVRSRPDLVLLDIGLPAVPPLLIGVPFIFNLAGLPEPGVMVGMSSPAVITAISLGIFAAIYAIYSLLAYTSLKRNVLP